MHKVINNSEHMPLATQMLLAMQHILAVFLGTTLVPLLTGLPVSISLLFAGISTLIFHFFTRGKMPLLYSCSFVFIGAFSLIVNKCKSFGLTEEMGLSYACFGVFVSGFVYIILGQLLRKVPYKKIMGLFPPVLSGSYIIAMGIILAESSILPLALDWEVGMTAVIVTILIQYFASGAIKTMPINIGILAALILSAFEGKIDIQPVCDTPWIAQPFNRDCHAFNIFENFNVELLVYAVVTMVPLVAISVVEHVADVLAISKTTRIDYIKNIGLPRTLSANGLSTILAAMFGAPPTASFSQTTGLLMINKVYSPALIRMAAVGMIILSCSPRLSALMAAIPSAAIGGVTLIMYLMIIVVGIRTFVDSKVDFRDARNIFIMGTLLLLTIGIKFGMNDSVMIFGFNFSAMTIAVLVGTFLNIILPQKKSSPSAGLTQRG